MCLWTGSNHFERELKSHFWTFPKQFWRVQNSMDTFITSSKSPKLFWIYRRTKKYQVTQSLVARIFFQTPKQCFSGPVCFKKQHFKKQQKKIPGQLLVCKIGDLWRTSMIPNWLYMSPIFPWSSRINLVPFRIFRSSLFYKPVTGQELFLLFLTANRL